MFGLLHIIDNQRKHLDVLCEVFLLLCFSVAQTVNKVKRFLGSTISEV
jgi:hypothetical protein